MGVKKQLDRNIKIIKLDQCEEYNGDYDESSHNPNLFVKLLEQLDIVVLYTMLETLQ